MPLNPFTLLLLLLSVVFLVVLVQVGAIPIAFDKLGLSPGTGMLLLFGSLIGSGINIPLFERESRGDAPRPPADVPLPWGIPRLPWTGRTVIAVNVGGCLIPVGVSLYLLGNQPLSLTGTALALAIVTFVSYRFSRPIPGIGIGMPLLLAPLTAVLAALLLDPAHSAPVAYISGTLGVLIGADILHLREMDTVGAPLASIGGAGTFDGIFFTGIIAALLA